MPGGRNMKNDPDYIPPGPAGVNKRREQREQRQKDKRQNLMSGNRQDYPMRPEDRPSEGERTGQRERSGPVRTQTALGSGEDPTERRPESNRGRRRRRPPATQTAMNQGNRLG